MAQPGRNWNDANGDYRYGAGGQEKLNEISGSGNHYTAHFWEMDPRLGIRWNRDPKPNPSVSDYAIFADNPIMITDILGDSCVVNNKGTIVHFDPNDNDKRVFAQLDGKLSLIGTLGGKIDANNIYANLLNENMKEAKDLWSPLTFREYVKNHGKWDYKNDDRSIFGLANDGKTKFLFQNKEMESQDIGNHHFGVVVKAYGLFPGEQFILAQAGNAQITSGTSKKEWQPTLAVTRYDYIEHGMKVKTTDIIRLPPYGDDPRDQEWIKAGFKYYENVKK